MAEGGRQSRHGAKVTSEGPRCPNREIEEAGNLKGYEHGEASKKIGRSFALGNDEEPVPHRQCLLRSSRRVSTSDPQCISSRTTMDCLQAGDIPRTPSEVPGSPRYIDVIVVGEEVLIQSVAVDGDVLEHGAAVKNDRSGAAFHIFFDGVVPFSSLSLTAVVDPSKPIDNESCGVQSTIGKKKSRTD